MHEQSMEGEAAEEEHKAGQGGMLFTAVAAELLVKEMLV